MKQSQEATQCWRYVADLWLLHMAQEAERDGTGAKPEDVGRLEPSLL